MRREYIFVLAPCLMMGVSCDSGRSTQSDSSLEKAEGTGSTASSSSEDGTRPQSASASGGASQEAAGGSATLSPGMEGAGVGTGGDSELADQASGGKGGDNQSGGGGTESRGGADGEGSTGSGGDSADLPGEWSEHFPTFTKHSIADFPSGYYIAVFDVDGDGQEDVVALSSGATGLAWFKNPSWESFAIEIDTERFICMAPYDVDGDGRIDLAIGSEFDINDSESGGTVYWAKAPEDPSSTFRWESQLIDTVPATHRLRWGDIDGDGKKELLNLPIFGIGASSPEYVGVAQLKAYSIPSDLSSPWDIQILDDSLLEVAHGINVVDWDGDESEDILTATNAGVHLFRPSLAEAPLHLGLGVDAARPDRGSSEVGLGSLGGERFLATIEPWHGTDTVIYTPGASESEVWNRQTIAMDLERGHALAVADLNGDGFDEIIVGDQRGEPSLMIYRYIPSTEAWEAIVLESGGLAVTGVEVKDINGDGALDVAAIGGDDLIWYENIP